MYKAPIRGRVPLKKKPEPSFSLEEFAGSVGNVGALAQELKELKDEVIEVVDYKIEEVENTLQDHIKTIVDTTKVLEDTKSEAIALINEIKVGPAGIDADEKRVADMVRSQFPDAKKLEKDILAKVPKFDEKKLKRDILENIPKASLKVIQSKLEVDPLSVVEKIMALPKGKFKFTMDNVEGLKQTMSAFQSQLGRGYLHGGGDTVAAGTNITITTNAAGQKVINALGGGGAVEGVTGTSPIIVDNTDPANPIVTIQQANTSQSGYLSDTDWDTFNNKQPAGNYFDKSTDDTDDITVGATNKFATAAEKTKLGFISVTQAVDLDTMESDIATNNAKVTNATHTGDATGATTLTLATVNSNVGSFTNANITVNAKGLVTAASNGSGGGGVAWGAITGTLSAQTDLQTELDGKQDVITGLTASGAELNILDGATLTTTELNYVDGVTSNIQTQLNTKVDTTGTPANNYISVFTDADTIEGDTNFTWDGTTHTILGTSLLSKTGTATVGTPTYDSNSYKFQGSQWFTTGSVAKTLTGGLSMDLRETASVALGTINLGYSIDGGTERAVVSYKTGDHYNDGFTGQLTMRSGYTDGSTFSTGFGSGFGGVLETQYDGTFAFRPIGGASTDFSGMRALSFGTHSVYGAFWSRWGYGGGSNYGADIRTSFDGTVTIGAGLPDWHASAPAGASGSESLSVTIDQVITGNNASRPALRITKATEQLRLGYDASNYFQATVASTGSTTFNLVGTSPEFTFSDAVNVPDEAYGAGWNGNTEVPTKNAVYDQVELKAPLASPTFTGTVIGATIQANTGFLPDTDGGAYLGQGTQAFSGLFLDTTATINFDNSNVVLTHSSGILTMGTGDLRVTNAGTNSASVVTVGGTQTLTNKTLTAPTLTTPSAFTTGGTITLAENTSIALDPAGSADGKYSGITMTGVSGYSQAFGDLVYLSSVDSRWEAVDADAATTSDRMLAMVVVTGTDGNACTLLLQGNIRADAKFPALTIGSAVYAGETAGAIQVAIPTGADAVIRRVGFALTADEIYFAPSMDSQTTVA